MSNTKPAKDPTRDQLVTALREHAEDIRTLGVTSLAIFGSRARGDSRPDSDLDLLIDYNNASTFSLVTMVQIEHLLEDMLGLSVQVTTRSSVSADALLRIDPETIRVL